jgi:alpha-tubulin suppressor-like RCC1 family protein
MLAVGSGFACVVAKDGTVSCWGRNDFGQLGRDPASTPSCGAFPCSPTPTPVAGLAKVVRIAAGDDFACALDQGGNVSCWGNNAKRQLERVTDPTAFTPQPLIADVVDVVASGSHACVRQEDGTLRCWGENTCGIFGDTGGSVQPVARVLLGVPRMNQVSLSRDAMCGIDQTTGRVLCWGADHHGSLGHDVAAGAPLCGGVPSDPTPKSVQQSSDQLPIPDAAEVHIGDVIGCVRRTGGQISCWGDNSKGGLGQGFPDTTPHPRAVDVPSLIGSALAIGGGTGCAIAASRLICWGDSVDGQLEQLAVVPACGNQNCKALGYAVTNMNPVHELAIGPGALGAIKDDLTLWMWGSNSSSELAVAKTDPANVSCPAGVCIPGPRSVQGLPALF